MELVTDEFPYSNGLLATVSAGKWSKSPSYADLAVNAGRATQSAGAGFEHHSFITTWTGDTANQWAEIVYSVHELYVGPCIISNGDAAFYTADCRTAECYIYRKTTDGTYAVLATVLTGVTHGDRIRLGRNAGLLTLLKNDVQIASVTDTILVTGKPGLRYFTGALTAMVDSFKAGDYTAGLPFPPASGWNAMSGMSGLTGGGDIE